MPCPPKKNQGHKSAAYFILLILLYIYLPIYLSSTTKHPLITILLFFTANAAIVLFLFKSYLRKKSIQSYGFGKLQEEHNVCEDGLKAANKTNSALQAKIIRYQGLKNVVEEINESLSLETVAHNLVDISYSLVSRNKGTCILYLVDKQAQKLSIYKSRKEDKKLVIKEKEGDIFDLWVLRHASPLLVEDIKKDFRFDLEKLKRGETRKVSSLISAPFITEQKFLGILRIDSPLPNFFTLDDLRFLQTICDLGAVALENSELYQETQELAIHDSLTSLYTKGYFGERLKEECKRDLRLASGFSLLMLDIDYFKNYNDKFGHTAGDIVLKKISEIITASLKELHPVVSRFGGEEFCVMLPAVNKEKAVTSAERLRKNIETEKIILRRQETGVTVSIGLSSFPDDAKSDDELMLKADKALYEAKQKGRNRVCCA